MRQLWMVLAVCLLGSAWAQPAAPAPVGWQEVAGPAGTMCSDGSAWKFYVAQGDPRRVIVDFQGGGACWNDGTCGPESRAFARTVGAAELLGAQGLYNRASLQNPFFGWTHVFIPYCTADIHIGNSAKAYAGATVQHKGALNARAALDWVARNLQAPEQVFVTGCSAGAYGAAAWAPYLMRQYPSARVTQFGDAGVGVTVPGFGPVAYANWNIADWLPGFIPELNALRGNLGQFQLNSLYTAVARAFPRSVLSQYSTALDGTQIFFYGLMKGEAQPTPQTAAEWAQGALANLVAIKQAAPANFFSYLAPGSQHCVIPRPEFYTTRVGDVALTDWLRRLITTGNPGDVAPR